MVSCVCGATQQQLGVERVDGWQVGAMRAEETSGNATEREVVDGGKEGEKERKE